MISLDFFDSSSKFGVVKATVHKTGKLGFSSGASKFMNIENINFFNIGLNKEEEDKSLYLVPVEIETEKSFKVVKAGDYYYVFIKNIMRELKIDYKNETVIYDIEEMEYENNKMFKLIRRERK
ncbi:hypothetical protein [Lutibacter sp. B1]|uniref:hypothetical protein n=1 Tax=Lutibacter sp. B1 TaxID=2725996 RepID=UPI001456D9CE|nr:hypothetical protein [Lutibacter sp. B1]NLP56600.1 hypothetical protein [Lutibacter sp. B1]